MKQKSFKNFTLEFLNHISEIIELDNQRVFSLLQCLSLSIYYVYDSFYLIV